MSLAASLIPILGRVEANFQSEGPQAWVRKNWTFSIYASVLYLVTIFSLKKWMEFRKPFNLRTLLVMWNTGLALFSFLGVSCMLPELTRNLLYHGVTYTGCYSNTSTLVVPYFQLWGWLFALSKVFELGDTIFIVLRKTPLTFLHWYHHITVFVYTWYAITDPNASSHWFSTMNYVVHTVMYSYYAWKASGRKISSKIAQVITFLQIAQMIIGIFVNLVVLRAAMNGIECKFQYDHIVFGFLIYLTYVILFVKFFIERYVRV